VGVELEYAMQRWLVLGAGAGPTFSGGQAGVWLAPRWTFTSVAVGVDLGASMGPYREWAIMDEHGPWVSYEMAGWFNAAARFQYLSWRGFSFRAFLGVTTLLNPGAGRCNTGSEDIPCRRRKFPYGGLAFGYAFSSDEALRRPARRAW
jgi:hypothetical protein